MIGLLELLVECPHRAALFFFVGLAAQGVGSRVNHGVVVKVAHGLFPSFGDQLALQEFIDMGADGALGPGQILS